MLPPLDGVRVLDLTRLLPGPFATLILSDLGAEVIKVEDPNGGDYLRKMPPLCSDGTSVFFHTLNRGKKSISLDLSTRNGKQSLCSLLQDADVLVESFRPGTMEKFGLNPTQLQNEHPHLVWCSISGYGQNSEEGDKAGHDINFLAKAGILRTMSSPHALPVKVADIAGGAWPAALQIIAAVLKKTKTGVGSYIDVSITEGVSSSMLLEWGLEKLGEDLPPTGGDPLLGDTPCYGVYKTKDGFLSVGAIENKFFNQMVQSLGLPQLRNLGMTRGDEGQKITHTLQKVFLAKTTNHWARHFATLDVCVEPVLEVSAQQRFSKVNLASNEQIELPMLSLSPELAKPSTVRAPALGEHNKTFLDQKTF